MLHFHLLILQKRKLRFKNINSPESSYNWAEVKEGFQHRLSFQLCFLVLIFFTRGGINSLSLMKTINQSTEKPLCFGRCTTAINSYFFLKLFEQVVCSSISYGFNSYTVPRTVWGAFLYFISLYSQRSLVRWIKQSVSHSWGNRLNCLAQGHRASLWQGWGQIPYHLILHLICFAHPVLSFGGLVIASDFLRCQPSGIKTHTDIRISRDGNKDASYWFHLATVSPWSLTDFPFHQAFVTNRA